MKEVMVFGRKYRVVEEEADSDSVTFSDSNIIVKFHKKPAKLLLKDFLTDILYSELFKIYDQIKDKGKVEIFGNLDFEIVEKIDRRKDRIAKLKGNKILIKLNAVALPKEVLKYIVVHEIAHVFTKKHSSKFWKIVETIYPDFKKSQEILKRYEKFVNDSSIF